MLLRHEVPIVTMSESFLKSQGRHCLVAQCGTLHLSLRLEHCKDEFEGSLGAELCYFRLELAHSDLLDVEHVIDETQEHVELKDDEVDDADRLLVINLPKQVLQEHQRSAEGCAKFVGDRRREALQRLNSVPFVEYLRLKKQFLNVLGHVLEVDCYRRFLQVLDRLGTDEGELALVGSFTPML